MKRLISYICIIIVFALCLVMPVFAAENQNSKASNYFATSSVYLSPTTGNSFNVCFSVTAVGKMDELGASVITVQRRASANDPWENMRSYYPSNHLQMIDYNQTTHAATVSYTGSSGYEYRAYVELYAKKGTGTAYMGTYAY